MERNLQATIASGHDLDVRRFSVSERISQLFQVDLEVLTNDASPDFDAIVGRPASFSLEGAASTRRWTGHCSHFEQVAAEASGASTYQLTIVPKLWFLTQRRNYRIFQQMAEPEIVLQLLGEWEIAHELRIDRASYKSRKYRVQYAESDYAFMCRMLEDAGISFVFEADKLVLTDAPQATPPRAPIHFRAGAQQAGHVEDELVTDVRLAQRVRPRRYTMRDHDYRLSPRLALIAESRSAREGIEDRLEQYHYVPGAFSFGSSEGADTPVADDRGKTRTDQGRADVLATRRLEAKRGTARTCTFATSVHALSPGTVVPILDHPHADLGPGRPVMVVEAELTGGHDGEWSHRCVAHAADIAYRPELSTPKPRVHGVESATVVGPAGEEIHTDEFGRVRVQFHWDRYGKMDHNSSCWIHVSQPWAGSAFGGMNVPRIGQEVVVDFLNGDPDRPVIIGRVYTALQAVPYKLPENKTQGGFRSNSSPGGGGFNELMFEDAAGKELVNIQAEKDLTKLVKNNEDVVIGNNRDKLVRNDATETIGQSKTVSVGVDRTTNIGHHNTLKVGEQYSASIAPVSRATPTTVIMVDKKIRLDTGAGASITLDGSEITIEAEKIRFFGEKEIFGQVKQGDLKLVGGPMVKVNC